MKCLEALSNFTLIIFYNLGQCYTLLNVTLEMFELHNGIFCCLSSAINLIISEENKRNFQKNKQNTTYILYCVIHCNCRSNPTLSCSILYVKDHVFF